MPDLAADLRAAEQELQTLRGQIATVARFVHDDSVDLAARITLAGRLHIPAPRTAFPKETAHVR